MPVLPPPTTPVASVVAPPPVTAPAGRYGFNDAWLGESLVDWRASRPLRATLPCTPTARDAQVVVCRGPDHPFSSDVAARELTYTFVEGRLARIAFRTSINGFEFVTAALKKAFSTPDDIVRDQLRGSGRPHLAMIWRNGRSTIELDDPLPDMSHLSVSFTVDALAAKVAPPSADSARSS